MQIMKEEIRQDYSSDIYWGRIHFVSDDATKKSTVLFCASVEYFWDLFGDRDVDPAQLNLWREELVENWKKRSDQIFDEKVHYESYAATPEGKVNGIEFLKKVKPNF